jgi:hypothetical protein
MLAPAKSLKIKFVYDLLYQTNKDCDVPMSASAYLKIVLHMCMRDQGCERKGWANGLKMGQLTCSMGLEWREDCILAPKATIPCFYNLKGPTHVFAVHCTIQYCINTVHFLSAG